MQTIAQSTDQRVLPAATGHPADDPPPGQEYWRQWMIYTWLQQRITALIQQWRRAGRASQRRLARSMAALLMAAGLLLGQARPVLAANPTFTERTGAANPFNGVNVGADSAPSFVDVDGDGDMDAFIGESDGNIGYYENTGTPQVPTFTERTGAANPFNCVNVGADSTPTFVDVDGDGDMDAFIGEKDGVINYYENTGSTTNPTFTERTGAANPFNGVRVGVDSTPTFVDVDGDGDMDAFIGAKYGFINYYENTGASLAPTFTERTGAANPLNGVNVGDGSAPTFVDVDGDGDMDAFIGGKYGHIHYYENTGTSLAPTFTERTGAANPLNGVYVYGNSAPSFVDVDGDGDMDAFIGEYYGSINYYENLGPPIMTPVFLPLVVLGSVGP